MSKYGEFSTRIKDGTLLCAALEGMGFTIEAHEQSVSLYGYHGDVRPEVANIIIRRQHTGIGVSNDIGFVRGSDGCYQAIISEYDRGAKFDDSWIGKLKQSYSEQRQMQVARNRGYVFQSREVVKSKTGGETVKLRFAVR